MGISVLLLLWLIFVWLFFQSEASYLACTENHKNGRNEITLLYEYVHNRQNWQIVKVVQSQKVSKKKRCLITILSIFSLGAQDSDLPLFLENLSRSEKPSEIKPFLVITKIGDLKSIIFCQPKNQWHRNNTMRRNLPNRLSVLISWQNLLNFSSEEYFIKCQMTSSSAVVLVINNW